MRFGVGRNRLLLILLLVLCSFLIYSSAGERGLIRLGRLARERDDLVLRVRALEMENEKLSDEIDLLRSDRATIESLARTELGMVREGEVVYIIPENTEGPDR